MEIVLKYIKDCEKLLKEESGSEKNVFNSTSLPDTYLYPRLSEWIYYAWWKAWAEFKTIDQSTHSRNYNASTLRGDAHYGLLRDVWIIGPPVSH